MVVRTGTGADTVVGTAGVDVLLGNNPSAAAATDGDTFTGGGGNDVIFGFGGNDTAIYAGTVTVTAVADADPFTSGSQAGWQVVTAGEGTDFVNDVELIDGGGAGPGGRVLLVGNGGFNSLADALALAASGDTIMLAAGTYVGNAVINVSNLTILGANAGVQGFGVRSAESIIDGALHITANNVTIDGLKILDGETVSGETAGILVQANSATIANTFLERTGTVDGDGYRGIVNAIGTASGLTIEDNRFVGWATGTYLNPGTDASVTGNSFESNFVGLSVDDPDGVTISGNTFVGNSFEAIGVGVYDSSENVGAAITGNNIVGTPEVSIYSLGSGPQTIIGTTEDDVFYAGSFDEMFTGGSGNDVFVFLAAGGTDLISDFALGAGLGDQLDLRAFGFSDFASFFAATVQGNGDGDGLADDIIINLGGGTTVVLQDSVRGLLQSDDVILV